MGNLSSKNKSSGMKPRKKLNTTKIKYPVPSEDEEAKLLHKWLELKGYPHTHIANEGGYGNKQAMIRGVKAKQMGQSKGVWDYEIFIPIRGVYPRTIDSYQEIRIELKRKEGGRVTKEQKEWGKIYEKAGIPCCIAKGAGEAIDFIETMIREIRCFHL